MSCPTNGTVCRENPDLSGTETSLWPFVIYFIAVLLLVALALLALVLLLGGLVRLVREVRDVPAPDGPGSRRPAVRVALIQTSRIPTFSTARSRTEAARGFRRTSSSDAFRDPRVRTRAVGRNSSGITGSPCGTSGSVAGFSAALTIRSSPEW
mgnify:CR=1 FL=1